jgi:sigma-B regulation protein RsbU (phosphoserine phosphatase)
MDSASMPRILLCADAPAAVSDVGQLLQNAAFHVEPIGRGTPEPADLASFQAAILDANGDAADCLALCQRLHTRIGDGYLPTLFISANSSPASRLASLECGADAYLVRPFDSAELLAHVRTLLRNKERHDRLADKSAEINRINKRLQQAYQQIDQELELARRIQESFLPHSLPEVPRVRFAVHYQPCGRVGGDFYDIFRLDEKHIGFYVADAMGHGVPASLLTIFVKTGVRAKEIFGKQYRLVPPDEVLQRLNRDLIQQQLSDTPFITMAYALFNYRDGIFSFSRSGHPYPLYIPRTGEPRLWQLEGSLLGVFDTRYVMRKEQLQPGDKLLMYTDGIDAAGFNGTPNGVQSLVAFADKHKHDPIDTLVRELPQELFRTTRQTDDLTVVGMEFLEGEAEGGAHEARAPSPHLRGEGSGG